MSYYYGPYGRRRPGRVSEPAADSRLSLDDVRKLAQAYQELATVYEKQSRDLDAARRDSVEQAKALAQVRQELAIKDEALQRQSEDLRRVEAELVWTRAALRQQDEEAEPNAEALTWRQRFEQLQGELDALRKRWEQRFEKETAAARHAILLDMLSLADNLELARRHGEQLAVDDTEGFVQNIDAVYHAFLTVLKGYGVTPMNALGRPFDPNLHEAVGRTQEGDTPSGHVAQVTRTGYVEGEKLLRAASVLVRD